MRIFIFALMFLAGTAQAAQAAQQSQHVAALSTEHGMVAFQKVIDSKCTLCHSRKQIDTALTQRQEIGPILERMVGIGAKLTEAETEILTAYWNDDQFAEINQVINLRCTGCHTRQRIDAAMANGENLTEIQEKMVRFGAQLSTKEQDVLGIFQGKPLK